MSHRIKIVENVVSNFDIKFSISLINKLENNGSLINFRDNPSVLIVPENNLESSRLIKKYSEVAKNFHIKDNGFMKPIYTTEAYLSLWNAGTEAGVHSDSNLAEYIMYSTVVYLNDNYDGGEIYFPNQDVEIKPPAGSMVLFPSGGHEYFHGVKPVISGRRYTIAMWHTMHKDYSPFDEPEFLNPLHRGSHPQ
jgi:hypothetical protein